MICYLFSKVVTMHMTHIYRHMHMLLAYTIFAINWSRISYIIMNHVMHVCMFMCVCVYIYIYYICIYARVHTLCVCVCVCVCVCLYPPPPPPHPPQPQPAFFLLCFLFPLVLVRQYYSSHTSLNSDSEGERKINCNECKHLVSNKTPQWFAWRMGGGGGGGERLWRTLLPPLINREVDCELKPKKIETPPFYVKQVTNRNIPIDLVTPLNHKTLS